ncbi:MAG TPA: hypothetical protein VFC46_01195, partial [Humisphaera sp.]|nr:hypothetical protein [Humisphaera sp.]
MSDFQKITDAIRAFLVAGDRSWNNELPDLAANYAAACREANDRMRRCAEYLRRGMRSEAVHLADCQPNLIEMAAALRFVETPDWAQVCAANGLTIAPPLIEGRADDLEEAREME